MNISLQQLAVALGGEISGNQILAPGPNHTPKDRSLSVRLSDSAPDGFVVHSFTGDDPLACKDYVRERAGLARWEPQKSGSSAGNAISRMASRVSFQSETKAVAGVQPFNTARPIAKAGSPPAEYIYKLADGTPYLRVKRTADKDFYQARWDGDAWVNGAPKGPKIPYRLPEMLASARDGVMDVLIAEGEKDADNLAALGFIATTNSGGADSGTGTKFTTDLAQWFEGRNVYVLPDNDEPGEKHAAHVVETLQRVARSIRVVRLPGLADKQDVSDWIEAGGTADELADMLRHAPEVDAPQKPTLPWLDMSQWDDAPIPERQWAIRDRVPLKQAGLFSGEGGTGKSILELMKNVAHVTGKDWLGSLPEPGPAFYLGAEDDKDEIHIRLAAIASHYEVSFRDLIDGGLKVLPLLGQDATLCAATKGGNIEVTALYRQIYEAAGDIKPKNISIDTLSRAFAGNEIDRTQVYAFAMHMQALAMVSQGAVTVLSHPSLQGISSGSGLSGSTAWHGAFRFRQYLKGAKAIDGEPPDNDLRELEFKKNQYGPRGESIVLRYQRGLFLPEGGASSLEKAARSRSAEDVFLSLLRRFAGQNRNVSDKSTAPNYAPSQFAKEDEATQHRFRKAELEQAMRALFKTGRIVIEQYGRPSRPYDRITENNDE